MLSSLVTFQGRHLPPWTHILPIWHCQETVWMLDTPCKIWNPCTYCPPRTSLLTASQEFQPYSMIFPESPVPMVTGPLRRFPTSPQYWQRPTGIPPIPTLYTAKSYIHALCNVARTEIFL